MAESNNPITGHLQPGYSCLRCGGCCNMYGTGHGEGVCPNRRAEFKYYLDGCPLPPEGDFVTRGHPHQNATCGKSCHIPGQTMHICERPSGHDSDPYGTDAWHECSHGGACGKVWREEPSLPELQVIDGIVYRGGDKSEESNERHTGCRPRFWVITCRINHHPSM